MDTEILLFISIIILFLFIIIEILRNHPELRSIEYIVYLNKFLIENIDERDNTKFILTHTFLLYGCFSSVIYSEMYNKERFECTLTHTHKYIGLIVLGIGDAFVYIIYHTI